mmetsp:Transcript_33047/g.51148  ORF Transcript_33047/g.51148 Transcript_33047/m.51148 type:complete len:150 (-) Transcript_33047:25-474(-)
MTSDDYDSVLSDKFSLSSLSSEDLVNLGTNNEQIDEDTGEYKIHGNQVTWKDLENSSHIMEDAVRITSLSRMLCHVPFFDHRIIFKKIESVTCGEDLNKQPRLPNNEGARWEDFVWDKLVEKSLGGVAVKDICVKLASALGSRSDDEPT